MHLKAVTAFCCSKAVHNKLNGYMQGYEITMADLVPEEDKVSCRSPENVSLDSTCGSTDAIVILRRRSSVAFVTTSFVAAETACGVRPGYQLCQQNQGGNARFACRMNALICIASVQRSPKLFTYLL